MRNDYTPTKKLDSDNDDSIYSIKKHKNSSIKIITGVLSIIIVIAIIIILYKGNFLKHTSKRKASNSSDDYIQSNVSNLGENTKSSTKDKELKASVLGIGGEGALFRPIISPHNSNDMIVITDMGNVYLSWDKGKHWSSRYLNGVCLCATYDSSNKNTVYVGGNGLYRSTDNGKTFEMIFPNKNDLKAKLTHNENGKTYIILIEKTEGLSNSNTKVFYTNDFKKQVDITSKLTAVKPTTFTDNTYGTGTVTYKYDFSYIDATSLDNIYVTNYTHVDSENYPTEISGIIRLSKGKAKLYMVLHLYLILNSHLEAGSMVIYIH